MSRAMDSLAESIARRARNLAASAYQQNCLNNYLQGMCMGRLQAAQLIGGRDWVLEGYLNEIEFYSRRADERIVDNLFL